VRHPVEPAPRFGSIIDGETLPLREAARRMGWQRRMMADVQRLGLRVVTIGRMKYTPGGWVRQFVEGLAQQQAQPGDGNEKDQANA
jgi:hypothetical protein